MGESTGIQVLHVDDEPDFADLTAEFIERQDDRFSVETATSASEGLDQLTDREFDCIVSDYDMPGQNGIEFLTTIRKEYSDLPFILYTGKGSEEVASDAIAAGATDYLQKGSGTDQYELLANRIQNAVEQYRSQQRAANLDRIRTLRSSINQALIRADSQPEAEIRVCEIISDADPYLFAWIGAVDSDTGRFEPRAWAGIEENYLDDITVSADETATGLGPGGTAFRERRVAVSQNIHDDPEFEPWRKDAIDRGYRAVAAVPLEHDDTLYGILGVYSGRAYAFDEDEKELLTELGTDIAHAFQSFSIRDELRRNTRALDKAPVGITLTDPSQNDNPLIYINEQFEEVTGYDSDEAIGRNCRFLQGEGTDTDPIDTMRQAIDAQEQVTVELRNYQKDGTEFWNRVSIAPVETDDSEVTNFVGFQEDITERKERDQAIEELHSTARALLEAETVEEITRRGVDAAENILGLPSNGIYLHDVEADALLPVAWTDSIEDLIGTPPTFAAGEGLAWEVFDTGEPDVYADVSTVPGRRNPDTDVRSEMILPLGDQGVFLIGSETPDEFDDTDVSLAGTLATHVTTALDRVDFEQTLREYKTLVETVGDPMFILDEDGYIKMANNAFLMHTDADEETVIGAHGSDFMTAESFERGVELLNDLLTNSDREWATYEITAVTTGGVRIPAEINLTPLTDNTGEFTGSVGVVREITERKERERELERQNERLEKFASVVSHDLRNPLNVASGRLRLAQQECESDELDNVSDALDRMETLIEDLLTLAREGEQVQETESVMLGEMVDGCWQSVKTANATLVCDTEKRIEADTSRLKQLLENLFRNAVEHGGEDAAITVSDLDDGFYIADDGPGIPEDEREKVFEAGYSTANEGTGFGLNIVQEIVEAHGWDITVTSSESGGARFEITGVHVTAE